DIKTLKSDVSKLKNDQGSYATKLYVDSKDEIVGDWSASWYQQVLPTSGAIFGRKLRSTHRTAGVEDAYCELYLKKWIDSPGNAMARLNLNDNGTNICWDFTNLYGGTMIFPGDSGYLKMGNCLMSYSKRGSNALIKFDYTDTLQIKYANHGSTMT
ncbi:tail fiber domain-containing protein, partial [Escherichia coli]